MKVLRQNVAGGNLNNSTVLTAPIEANSEPVQSIASIASAFDAKNKGKDIDTQLHEYRKKLYKNKRINQKVLANENEMKRVCKCGNFTIGSFASVYETNDNKYTFSNVETCSSVWICPSCNLKISAARRDEIKTILTGAHKDDLSFDMITLTVKHNRNDSFDESYERLRKTFEVAFAHRKYKKIIKQYDIQGFIKTTEFTYNDKGGYHPHFHLIFIHDLSTIKYEKFAKELFKIWSHVYNLKYNEKLSIKGFEYKKDEKIRQLQDLDIDLSIEQLTNYMIDDLALEATAEQSKTSSYREGKDYSGVNYWQMLQNADKYKRQIIEIAIGTKRKCKYTFSRGLKKRYCVEDLTDEQLANDTSNLKVLQFLLENSLFREFVRQEKQEIILNLCSYKKDLDSLHTEIEKLVNKPIEIDYTTITDDNGVETIVPIFQLSTAPEPDKKVETISLNAYANNEFG